jgi:hypothetical protein
VVVTGTNCGSHKAHYDKIDGLAEIDNHSTKQAKEGSQTVWKGDLIGVYVDGCFLPRLAPIPVMKLELTFQQFMDIHQSELEPMTFDAGKARLLELIDDSVPPEDPAKLVWIQFVSRHAG